jgi:hypothetical protein
VLFNLLAPAGWKVGLLRIEDVAIGCLVSLVVGVIFWPRGAAAVVGNDLADAFRRGAAYLTEAVDWALGTRPAPPGTGDAAVTAGIRLDEALRGFLAEQGTKKVSKEDLWMLVMGSMRLRLTAYSLAGLPTAAGPPAHNGHGTMADWQHRHRRGVAYARTALSHATADLTGFYEGIAALVGRPVPNQVLVPVVVPTYHGLDGNGHAGPDARNRPAADETGSVEGVRLLAAVDADGGHAGADGGHGVHAGADGGADGGHGGADEAAASEAVGVRIEVPDEPGLSELAQEPGGLELLRMITAPHHPHLLWVHEHLEHLSAHAEAITGPAVRVAEQRRLPWWR